MDTVSGGLRGPGGAMPPCLANCPSGLQGIFTVMEVIKTLLNMLQCLSLFYSYMLHVH